jgi:t-SNARE complex subunit (syntaxin)
MNLNPLINSSQTTGEAEIFLPPLFRQISNNKETTMNRKDQIEELREKLTKHIDFDKGKEIRNQLHDYAKQTYKPRQSQKFYMEFINANPIKLEVNHPQSTNFPYYFMMFTTIGQHILGDCLEECLDNTVTYALERHRKEQD